MVSLCCRAFLLIHFFLLGLQARRLVKENKENAENHESAAIERHVLPEIEVVMTVLQTRTNFTGTFHSEYDTESEGNAESSLQEEEAYLSWEVAWPRTGRRLEKFVRVRLPPGEAEKNRVVGSELTDNTEVDKQSRERRALKTRHRKKRFIFGSDNRLYIPVRTFHRRFPFASVVKISTGCTGTLVSPKHVLTAAHCIHDQKDYVSGYKDLKVGFIQGNGYFTWHKVNNSFLPNGWLIGNPEIASRFDYALLKLNEEIDKPFFKLGISENTKNGARKKIHFTAFEDDKPGNTLWYRYCRVERADEHVLYHYCDARPGSSGAGVYLWNYDIDDRSWERRLVGIFSGNRWVYYKEWWKKATNFNAAIRIDSAKYTQICQWMGTNADKSCKKKYYVT